MTLAPILKYAPPRLRQFFVGGPELMFESALSDSELAGRFRETLQSGLAWPTGPTGYVLGSTIHVRWGTGTFSDGFAPVFHGRLDTTVTGSRLIGRVSSGRFAQIFIGFWCGAILLISIVFIWTIFMPLAGYGLLWAANGMMCFGDMLHPDRSQKIIEYLRQTSDPTAT
jgi:hypothetical protein